MAICIDARYSSPQWVAGGAKESTTSISCHDCHRPLARIHQQTPRFRTFLQANGDYVRLMVRDGGNVNAWRMEALGVLYLALEAKNRGEWWTSITHDQCKEAFSLAARVFYDIEERFDCNHRARKIVRDMKALEASEFPKTRVKPTMRNGTFLDKRLSTVCRGTVGRGLYSKLRDAFIGLSRSGLHPAAWSDALESCFEEVVRDHCTGPDPDVFLLVWHFIDRELLSILKDPRFCGGSTSHHEGIHGLISRLGCTKQMDWVQSYGARADVAFGTMLLGSVDNFLEYIRKSMAITIPFPLPLADRHKEARYNRRKRRAGMPDVRPEFHHVKVGQTYVLVVPSFKAPLGASDSE
jgi:hypothetical protein